MQKYIYLYIILYCDFAPRSVEAHRARIDVKTHQYLSGGSVEPKNHLHVAPRVVLYEGHSVVGANHQHRAIAFHLGLAVAVLLFLLLISAATGGQERLVHVPERGD